MEERQVHVVEIKAPVEDVWAEILCWLEKEPDITAKTAFDRLQSKGESRFTSGQLRTLQRRIKDWRRVVAEHLISGSYDSAVSLPCSLPEGR